MGSTEKRGLSVLGAAFLIAGEMAGSGILSLPRAVVDSGYLVKIFYKKLHQADIERMHRSSFSLIYRRLKRFVDVEKYLQYNTAFYKIRVLSQLRLARRNDLRVYMNGSMYRKTGWVGIILVVIFCIISSYGGTRLGRCWEIIEERHPEYRGSTRTPYAVMAEESMGTFGRYLASASVQITLFGVGTVYLLQTSQIVQELLRNVWPNITFCIWLLIFAALITPPMWLGSPKDFWFVGVGALVSTSVSCILIFVQMVLDGIEKEGNVIYTQHGFMDFFLAIGVILYSFGGASTFPTIQNDMIHRDKFVISVCLGFTVILLMYLPVIVGGYLVYGDEINTNVILSLKKTPAVTAANVMLACHLITAFLIVVNPVSQEIENILNVSKSFSIQRCLVRCGIVILMVAVGESIPEFGKILALIGASTVTILTFVLPNLMYMILCNQGKSGYKIRYIPWYAKAFMCILIAIGVVGGVTSTYSAVMAIFSSQTFVKPCYWP